MRKLLLLELMLWGSAGAQAWIGGTGGTFTRFTGASNTTELQYVAPRQAALEETLLELSFTSAARGGDPTFCTKWMYIGQMGGSVVIQTESGNGGGNATQLQLNEALDKRNTTAGAAFASRLCATASLAPTRLLYVPLGVPVALPGGLTLTLKAGSDGRITPALK